MQRQQFVEERLQALSERVTQSEKSQAEVRHEFAKVIDSNEELRVEIQRLQGAVQEISYQLQHNTTNAKAYDILATKLAAMETRLGNLESPRRLPGEPKPPRSEPVAVLSPPAAPPPVSARPSQPTPSPPAPVDDAAADQLYQSAFDAHRQGNSEVAIIRFKKFLREHPKSPRAGYAEYWIGESLYAQQQHESAIDQFNKVIQNYPNSAEAQLAAEKLQRLRH